MHFFQVTYVSEVKASFTYLKTLKLDHSAQALVWFSTRTIATIDKHERLHLMDTRSAQEIDVADLGDVKLVYGTSFFKGVATGGNVSQAMAAAGERACYYSIASATIFTANNAITRVFLLGSESLVVFTLRTWEERVDWFVNENNYPSALALSLRFYKDEAKAVLGLPKRKPERLAVVADKMTRLLRRYMELSAREFCPDQGKIDALISHYQTVIPVCLQYGLALEAHEDNFLEEIYEKFGDDFVARGVFLESLQEHVLNGRLGRGMSAGIGKELLGYFSERQRFQEIEAMLVRLDVFSLDLHETMNMCKQQKLYDGLIYIQNQAFADYSGPLRDLSELVTTKLLKRERLGEEDIAIGNKLLVYVSCCLSGWAYPVGDLPTDRRERVRAEVVKFLLDRNPKEATIFPNLKALLFFDSKEFLNVLSLAFEMTENGNFSTEERKACQQQNQSLVDILQKVMVIGAEFMPSQVGALYTFLARQVSKQSSPILLSNQLLEQIVEFLTLPSGASEEANRTLEERQQALLELIQSGRLERHHLVTTDGPSSLLGLSEKAGL